MKNGLAILAILLAATCAKAQFGDPPMGSRGLRYDDVVSRIEARFEPATARRGETVTWILTVEVIPGWHTYPTKQTDPKAESQTSKIKGPLGTEVIPVGPIIEPANSLCSRMATSRCGVAPIGFKS